VNWLTHDVGDPLIGTPEYKVCAVRVERAAKPPVRRADQGSGFGGTGRFPRDLPR
jgi:hypothetical protein